MVVLLIRHTEAVWAMLGDKNVHGLKNREEKKKHHISSNK